MDVDELLTGIRMRVTYLSDPRHSGETAILAVMGRDLAARIGELDFSLSTGGNLPTDWQEPKP